MSSQWWGGDQGCLILGTTVFVQKNKHFCFLCRHFIYFEDNKTCFVCMAQTTQRSTKTTEQDSAMHEMLKTRMRETNARKWTQNFPLWPSLFIAAENTIIDNEYSSGVHYLWQRYKNNLRSSDLYTQVQQVICKNSQRTLCREGGGITNARVFKNCLLNWPQGGCSVQLGRSGTSQTHNLNVKMRRPMYVSIDEYRSVPNRT